MRGKAIGLAAAVGFLLCAGGPAPATAHGSSSWGVPLLGGLMGGYAFKSLTDSIGGSGGHSRGGSGGTTYVQPAPTYVVQEPNTVYVPTPAPAPATSTSSVESRLGRLETLYTNGYITQQEYERRREAIINGL